MRIDAEAGYGTRGLEAEWWLGRAIQIEFRRVVVVIVFRGSRRQVGSAFTGLEMAVQNCFAHTAGQLD